MKNAFAKGEKGRVTRKMASAVRCVARLAAAARGPRGALRAAPVAAVAVDVSGRRGHGSACALGDGVRRRAALRPSPPHARELFGFGRGVSRGRGAARARRARMCACASNDLALRAACAVPARAPRGATRVLSWRVGAWWCAGPRGTDAPRPRRRRREGERATRRLPTRIRRWARRRTRRRPAAKAAARRAVGGRRRGSRGTRPLARVAVAPQARAAVAPRARVAVAPRARAAVAPRARRRPPSRGSRADTER